MTTKTAKAKSKKAKKMALNDLKSWLDGFCSAHGPDWAPDAEQWNMIKDMIMDVVEYKQLQPQAQPSQQAYQPQQYQPQQRHSNVQYDMPPQNPTATLTEQSTASLPKPRQIKRGDGTSEFKTPSLDTSDGNYTSGFEG